MNDQHVVVRVLYGEVRFLLPLGLEGLLQHVFWPDFVMDVPVVSRTLLFVLLKACGGCTRIRRLGLGPLACLNGNAGFRCNAFAFLLLGDHNLGHGCCLGDPGWLIL